MSGPVVELPPMPALAEELLVADEAAHRDLAAALEQVGPVVRAVFAAVQRRRLVEALAGVRPVFPECDPPLVAPRRRHLSRDQCQRFEGAQAALRHVETRLELARRGLVPSVIGAETPLVLHALCVAPGGGVGGVLRLVPVGFSETESPYAPPAPERCGELLAAAVEFAATAPAPALTRAGWLMATLFALHPFADGNDRTARLMFHAVHSAGLPGGYDWATATEWIIGRRSYLDAVRATQLPSLPAYDPVRLEPVHLMVHAARSSIVGARRALERLHALERMVDELLHGGLGEHAALVEAFVRAERNVRLDELTELGLNEATATAVVESLLAAGRLRWARAGSLNPAGEPAQSQ